MIDKLEQLALCFLFYGTGAMSFCYVTMPWHIRQTVDWKWMLFSPIIFPVMVMRDLVRLVVNPNHDKP